MASAKVNRITLSVTIADGPEDTWMGCGDSTVRVLAGINKILQEHWDVVYNSMSS
jgi:hypothetical protein